MNLRERRTTRTARSGSVLIRGFALALSWLACTDSGAEDRIGDFVLESSRIQDIVEPGAESMSTRRGIRYITDELVIDQFTRYSGRDPIYIFVDRLHLQDCLFLDYDDPSMGEAYQMRPPAHSCAAVERLLERRTPPILIDDNSPEVIKKVYTRVHLVARELTCEDGKYLYIDASQKSSATRADGGIRYLVGGPNGAHSCIKFIGDDSSREQTYVRRYAQPRNLPKKMLVPASYAVTYALHRVVQGMQVAKATGDWLTFAKLNQRMVSLGRIEKKDRSDEHSDRFTTLIAQAGEIAESVGYRQLYQTLSISVLESPTRVDVVFDLDEMRAFAVPSWLFVNPTRNEAGSYYLGALEFDPVNANELTLVVDTVFGVDPLVEQALKRHLVELGWEYGGVSFSWAVRDMVVDLVDGNGQRPVIVPKADGSGAMVKFFLRDPVPNSTIFLLSKESGIPVSFNAVWQSVEHAQTASFSLGRASEGTVHQVDGELRNMLPVHQTVKYVLEDGVVHPLELQLSGFDVYPLTKDVELLDGAVITVPFGSDQIPHLFKLSTRYSTVTSLKVQNLLGAHDALDESLDHVSVEISVFADGDLEYTKGPYRLAPISADGSEATISFISRAARPSFRVRATANYSGGSSLALSEINQSSNIVKLTEDLLPSIQ